MKDNAWHGSTPFIEIENPGVFGLGF